MIERPPVPKLEATQAIAILRPIVKYTIITAFNLIGGTSEFSERVFRFKDFEQPLEMVTKKDLIEMFKSIKIIDKDVSARNLYPSESKYYGGIEDYVHGEEDGYITFNDLDIVLYNWITCLNIIFSLDEDYQNIGKECCLAVEDGIKLLHSSSVFNLNYIMDYKSDDIKIDIITNKDNPYLEYGDSLKLAINECINGSSEKFVYKEEIYKSLYFKVEKEMVYGEEPDDSDLAWETREDRTIREDVYFFLNNDKLKEYRCDALKDVGYLTMKIHEDTPIEDIIKLSLENFGRYHKTLEEKKETKTTFNQKVAVTYKWDDVKFGLDFYTQDVAYPRYQAESKISFSFKRIKI